MNSTSFVITNAGVALISAATAQNKIKISKLEIGSGVATPVAGQIISGSATATALANVKFTAQDKSCLTGVSLDKNSVAVNAIVPKGNTNFWIAQIGVYSGTVLVAILSIPAVYHSANQDVYVRGTFVAAIEKFLMTAGVYGAIASSQNLQQSIAGLDALLNTRFPTASEGSTFIGKNGHQATKLVLVCPIAETTAEVDAEKTRGSGSDIFNNWKRFSHHTLDNNQPASASDMAGWEYVSASDSVRCTLNTNSYVGFVSQKTHEKYSLDLDLSSDSIDGDDDGVCVVMAYAVDENGFEHTLSLIRSVGGIGFSFAVVKNYLRTNQVIIHSSNKIAWGNGRYGATIEESGYVLNSVGWRALGKTRAKVTRDGTKFTAITSEFGANWQNFKADSLIEFDLNNYPELAVFKGRCPYGYSAHSQERATFQVRSFTDEQSSIIDIPGNRVWNKVNSAWVATQYTTPIQLVENIVAGKMYHNPVTGKTFYSALDGIKRIF